MKKIVFDVDPYTFTGSAFIIGLILVNELSSDEQDSVGNWLQLVGLVMQTYASQVTTIQSDESLSSEKDNNSDIDILKKAIDRINDKLTEIKMNSKEI